jgi:hypothetical protein
MQMTLADITNFLSHSKPYLLRRARKDYTCCLEKEQPDCEWGSLDQAYSHEEKHWKESNVLGSLMGDEEDVMKRVALATGSAQFLIHWN